LGIFVYNINDVEKVDIWGKSGKWRVAKRGGKKVISYR
jgi:hypothetical protein